MKITIKDIARESGYAVGTVSRVLNNRPDVSEKAKKKRLVFSIVVTATALVIAAVCVAVFFVFLHGNIEFFK